MSLSSAQTSGRDKFAMFGRSFPYGASLLSGNSGLQLYVTRMRMLALRTSDGLETADPWSTGARDQEITMKHVSGGTAAGAHLESRTLALVLAGGNGTRLADLTRWQAKPAVFFGGKFRNVDFSLSNCVNSGIRRIAVLTQYKAQSLIQHVQEGWSVLPRHLGEFVEVWPAQQRLHGDWYRGTADAVFQNLEHIRALAPRCVLVLAGDHVYKMDYRPLLDAHRQSGAHLTVACVDVPAQQASAFGVIDTDAEQRIVGFVEKPPTLSHRLARNGTVLASMGVYVFDTEFLYAALEADAQRDRSSHDFGRDVIPQWIGAAVVRAFPFRDPATQGPAYWRDVGTLDAYWAAHMDLLADPPRLDLYDQDWPIWTHAEQLPPATVRTLRGHPLSTMDRAILSDGVQITSAEIVHSLLSMCVRVDAGTHIADSVVLPAARIGAGCHVRRAIIDAHCEVPSGTKIGLDRELDRQRFHVTSAGIIFVTQKDLVRLPRPDALDCAADVVVSRVYETVQENVA